MKALYEQLTEYGQSDYYGFHMPGHKRNDNIMGNGLPYRIDITEIEGFDDLHHARGILKMAQERAAKVYHADETCYLINGSTSGILSAVLGCTRKGGRILMARNCHKSVYAAVYMNELKPVYIYPEYDAANGLNGAVDAGKIRELLEADVCDKRVKAETETGDADADCSYGERIQAVVIPSPTYDGVVSDVERIAEAAHEFGIPLIVDEAHGAHFGFHPYFPENANRRGADVVIHSLHKTLPSLTQTALLHINGDLVNRGRIRKYVHMLQTSSPSYVLMASIDECIRFLETSRINGGKHEFEVYVKRLERLRAELGKLNMLRLVETPSYDKSKIVISTRGTLRISDGAAYTGKMLYEELFTKYHLQMEMASREYVLAMTSVCDTDEGFRRLRDALYEIDGQLECEAFAAGSAMTGNGTETVCAQTMELPRLEMYCTSARADVLAERKDKVISCPVRESAGKVSLEYAYVYPPGIPIIVPGERISEEAVHLLEQYERAGFDIEGLERERWITVLSEA